MSEKLIKAEDVLNSILGLPPGEKKRLIEILGEVASLYQGGAWFHFGQQSLALLYQQSTPLEELKIDWEGYNQQGAAFLHKRSFSPGVAVLLLFMHNLQCHLFASVGTYSAEQARRGRFIAEKQMESVKDIFSSNLVVLGDDEELITESQLRESQNVLIPKNSLDPAIDYIFAKLHSELRKWRAAAKSRQKAERDHEIVRLRDKDKLTFGKIGRKLLEKNPAWAGKSGQPLSRDAVEKAYHRAKKRPGTSHGTDN